jgi:hypothetical protein
MSLFVPIGAIEGIQRAQMEATQQRVDELIDQLQVEVAARTSSMVAIATEEGARQMAAAIFLLRACELLKETRAADGDVMLQSLGLRTIFELAIVGRFLVVHPAGVDEFRRRFTAGLEDEESLARVAGVEPGGAPDFLADIAATDQKKPRDLAAIAQTLDRIDKRESEKLHSAVRTYKLVYGYVSNAGSHAHVLSIKRFTKREDSLLSIDPHPRPIFEQPSLLLVVCFLRELAEAVFTILGLPTDGLPTEIQRPAQENHDEE